MTSTHLSIAFIGDPFVGKTSLIQKLLGHEVGDTPYRASVGGDMFVLQAPSNTTINIWDVAGLERLVSIAGHQFPKVDVCVLVCDVTNTLSFQHLRYWHDELIQATPFTLAPPSFIVAVAKCDTYRNEQTRRVSVEEVTHWSVQEHVDPSMWADLEAQTVSPYPPVIEVSARDGTGVETLLETILMRGKRTQRLEVSLQNNTTVYGNLQARAFALTAVSSSVAYGGEPSDDRRSSSSSLLDMSSHPPLSYTAVAFGDETCGKGMFLSTAFCSIDPYNPAETSALLSYVHTFAQKNDAAPIKCSMWSVNTHSDRVGPIPFIKNAACAMFVVHASTATTSLQKLSQWREYYQMESYLRQPNATCLVLVVIGAEAGNPYASNASVDSSLLSSSSSSVHEKNVFQSFATDWGMHYMPLPDTEYLTLFNTTRVMEEAMALTRKHIETYVTNRVAEMAEWYRVHCPRVAAGCQWMGKSNEVSTHTLVCDFEPITCRFDKCNKSMLRKERIAHEAQCAYRPNTCHLCEMVYTELQEHLTICPKQKELRELLVECPLHACGGCGTTALERQHVAQHVHDNAGGHIIMLSSVVQSLRNDLLLEGKRRIEFAADLKKEFLAEIRSLKDELDATKREVEKERELRKDVQIELKAVWEDIEAHKKQS
eukprot:PhM_4_TR8288/c0_g1_i1/m.92555